MGRYVTVPGYSFRGPQDPPEATPIIAYIEGGIHALSHQLGEEIRRQLELLKRETLRRDPNDKSWDVT